MLAESSQQTVLSLQVFTVFMICKSPLCMYTLYMSLLAHVDVIFNDGLIKNNRFSDLNLLIYVVHY